MKKLWKLKPDYIATHSVLSESDTGVSLYVVSETNPDTDKYEDITSIENIYANQNVYNDYLQFRKHIDDLFNSGGATAWANATDVEKQIIIDLHLRDRSVDITTSDTNKVMFLMGKGMSVPEAQAYLVNAYAEHHVKDKAACTLRADSKQSAIVVATYLSLADATDFINKIKTLLELYTSRGIKGINYDSYDYGLFDYFESTPGSPYENTGLASNNYILKTGTLQDLINGLLDVLWEGNY